MSRKTIDQADHFTQASPTLIVRGTTLEQRELVTLTNLAMTYSKEQLDVKMAQVYKNVALIKQKQKIEHDKAMVISERERAERNTPINLFIKVIQNRKQNPCALRTWGQNPQAVNNEVYREFCDLASRRGLPLSDEDIDFALNFLANLTSKSEEPQKASLTEKIKGVFK
jgi:hypothetical protein